MSKIKYTKGELKRQRDGLKQFRRYLPTLILKKQQLQMKIREVHRHLNERLGDLQTLLAGIKPWCGLLADETVPVKEWVTPKEIRTSTANIAGAGVPVFEDLIFEEVKIDFYATPFWVDEGLAALRTMVRLTAEVEIIRTQLRILERELRTTTQRVNLFEKVKIPEGLENIRRIRIYLGDQMANAVGISKVAKAKVEARTAEAIGV